MCARLNRYPCTRCGGIQSDTLFLGGLGLGLPPAKLDPSRVGCNLQNATKPDAWVHNPHFWSSAHHGFLGKAHPPTLRRSNPQFWSSNRAQPDIRQENEIMRMISSFPLGIDFLSFSLLTSLWVSVYLNSKCQHASSDADTARVDKWPQLTL